MIKKNISWCIIKYLNYLKFYCQTIDISKHNLLLNLKNLHSAHPHIVQFISLIIILKKTTPAVNEGEMNLTYTSFENNKNIVCIFWKFGTSINSTRNMIIWTRKKRRDQIQNNTLSKVVVTKFWLNMKFYATN